MAFELTSSAFAHEERIPTRYTCQGHNISPPLQWRDPPSGTQSLALIMDDPDAPSGTHRYFFKLYALDTKLKLSPHPDKAQLLQAMEGHILTQAELMGTYSRR